MITIIDYGSGNLKSIKNGFRKIGVEATLSNKLSDLRDAEAMILPGVGAFGNAMKNLQKYEEVIYEHVESKKPFLGICLGLQVIFTCSEESEGVEGLNLLEGEVIRFPDSLVDKGMKIPHMGWNELKIKRNCPILKNIQNDYMYFVHSYYVSPADEEIVSATVDYGIEVPAVIFRDNIYATQFHPEKSGQVGLEILRNFVGLLPQMY
ncbi:MAG TPA: imidazole glycerol phosphate synthase subunit HisH [Methanobacterium sp.]|nr:imidazole glycerol phosphate synthase subunit HisH [Methanobacterium sp.]